MATEYILALFSFFFCLLSISAVALPQMSTVLLVPTGDTNAPATATESHSGHGSWPLCWPLHQLLITDSVDDHSLAREYYQICQPSPLSSLISMNVVSYLSSQIFVSHIISLLSVLVCLFFFHCLPCMLGHRRMQVKSKRGFYLLDLTLGEERQRIHTYIHHHYLWNK